jgi:hypothetical protein
VDELTRAERVGVAVGCLAVVGLVFGLVYGLALAVMVG